MKTRVIEVGGLLSALSAHGVQKQLARLRGVTKVEVNYVAGSATVTYDETLTDLRAIKARVHERIAGRPRAVRRHASSDKESRA